MKKDAYQNRNEKSQKADKKSQILGLRKNPISDIIFHSFSHKTKNFTTRIFYKKWKKKLNKKNWIEGSNKVESREIIIMFKGWNIFIDIFFLSFWLCVYFSVCLLQINEITKKWEQKIVWQTIWCEIYNDTCFTISILFCLEEN